MPKPDNAIEDPTEIRAKMTDRLLPLKSQRYREVVFEYFGEKDRVKVRQLILIERPDRVRIQTRVPASDEIVSLLVTKDGTFAMHDRKTNRYYTGPANRRALARLLPLELDPEDIVSLMLGSAPWKKVGELEQSSGQKATLDWDSEKGLYTYVVADTTEKMTIYIDPNSLAVTEVKLVNQDDELLWHYTTARWKDFDSYPLPQFRRFVIPPKDVDLSISFEAVENNPELPEVLFELEPPAGSEVITQ